MTVFDASVLVDALVVAGPAGHDARDVLRDCSALHVPSIFTAEAASDIRSMQARGDLSPGQARSAVSKIRIIRTVQYPFEPFIDRVVQPANADPAGASCVADSLHGGISEEAEPQIGHQDVATMTHAMHIVPDGTLLIVRPSAAIRCPHTAWA